MTTDATTDTATAATPVTPAPAKAAPSLISEADDKALRRVGYVLGAGAGVCAVMAVYTGLTYKEASSDFNSRSQISRTVQRDTQSSFMVKASSSQFLR